MSSLIRCELTTETEVTASWFQELAELFVRFRNGSEGSAQAERELFDRLRPRLVAKFKRYAVAGSLSIDDIEDMTNEVLIKLWTERETIEKPRALEKWLGQAALNIIRNRWRVRDPQRNADDIDDPVILEVLTAAQDDSSMDMPTLLCIQRELERFGKDFPEHMEALDLCALEDLSEAEIGVRLGKKWPRQFLYECRKRARRYLSVCLVNE